MARDESLAGPDHNLSEIITLADLGLGVWIDPFSRIILRIFSKIYSRNYFPSFHKN
jgi:hypothetical protein